MLNNPIDSDYENHVNPVNPVKILICFRVFLISRFRDNSFRPLTRPALCALIGPHLKLRMNPAGLFQKLPNLFGLYALKPTFMICFS